MKKLYYLMVVIISSALLSCSSSKVYTESGITNLTQLTTDRTFEVDPCVSKDGEMIAFASDRSGNLEIWMMPTGGGGIQQVTSNMNSIDRAPDLSANKEEIVFQSTRVTGVWNIWKISLGNRGLTQLSNNPRGCFVPKWSPDSRKIAYTALDKEGNPYIWVMSSNGANPTQLGPGVSPDWSPDGEKIVFSKETIEENFDIWVINADGTSPIQITVEKEKQELYPVWSSDGKRIAYVVQYEIGDFYNSEGGRKISEAEEIRSEVWMMEEFGRNQTQLTEFEGLNISPSWYPDGKIAFVSSRDDSWDIWAMTPISKK